MEPVAQTRDLHGETLLLTVPGDLLSTNAEVTRAAAFAQLDDPAVLQAGVQIVEIDLRRAGMVDSVGLNVLVSIIRAAKKIGASVRLSISSPNVLRTFQFTRLDMHAEIRRIEAE